MFDRRNLAKALLPALALGAVLSCSDSTGPDDEPDVATMRVTIGATPVSFTGGCTPSVASVTIPAVGASVTGEFLRADGSPDPAVTAAEFQLRVIPEARFTRTGAFTGTLSGGTAGQAQVSFSLFHVEEQHDDFGPCSLTVIVQ